MAYNTEADLVAALRSNVPAIWGDDATSLTEVWCHDQAHMDILVWTPTTLIAIEAKLTDWGQALAQAYLHRWCVDYSYVALPTKAVTEARLAEARRFGIGVIAVDSTSADIRQKAGRNQPAERIRQRLDSLGRKRVETLTIHDPSNTRRQNGARRRGQQNIDRTGRRRRRRHG